MKTVWGEGAARKSVVAPVSLIISAFAPVGDVRKTWTPQLRTDLGATVLLLVDLGAGAQPPRRLVRWRRCTASSARRRRISTIPQLLTQPRRRAGASCARRTWCWPITIAPTAACSRRWWKWPSPAIAASTSNYPPAPNGAAGALFTEELGVVLQVKAARRCRGAVGVRAARAGRADARASARPRAKCACASRRPPAASTKPGKTCAAPGRRPRSACASCATNRAARARNSPPPATPARRVSTSRSPSIRTRTLPRRSSTRRGRKVAVLREQGVNSQVEMAAVFERVGFEPHDVHMSDVLVGPREARRIPRPRGLRRIFLRRRARRRRGLGQVHPVSRRRARRSSSGSSIGSDTFTLGVCNGCQMFAALKEIVPGRRAAGRASCAIAASSSKGASRWSSCSRRRRSSSPAWTVRCCRLPSRTARAAPSSRAMTPRRAFSASGLVARVTSKATARWRLTTPPIPTARRSASPPSPMPTAA